MMNRLVPALTALLLCATPPLAAEKKPAAEPEGYTIGLSMYSLRQLIRNGEFTALEYPKFAKETFGITEIDVWGGLFPQGKADDLEFCRKMKEASDAAGTNIFLLMVGAVDATGGSPDELARAGAAFLPSVDQAVALGADYVRVFLKAPDGDRDAALEASRTALTPLADRAKEKGITIVIEPGASKWARQGPFLADLAKKMDHPALRLMPDFGKMIHDDPYGGTEAMMPYSACISAKSHNFDEEGNEKHLDYTRLMKTVNEAGYTGIVAIEYEGTKLGPVEGVRATQRLLERLRP